MKKKILFFTGTRADYGLLSRLIKLFSNDENYVTKILATGTHLEARFGNSIQEIYNDGLEVTYQVPLMQESDSESDVCKSVGRGITQFSDVIQSLQPDLCFVLGDRFEALAFCFAAHVHHCQIAHIHGGEITEGAIDDSFRHAITKLSFLHFTTAEEHRNRVIQLGEEPHRVFCVGALGVDNAIALKKVSKKELEIDLKIVFKKRLFLLTYHPETISQQTSSFQIDQVITSVIEVNKLFPNECVFVFTMPNADPGYEPIRQRIAELTQQLPESVFAFSTLGKVKYLSLMALSDIVVGNSSSGLIEAPAMSKWTLNIGGRQRGRLSSQSVVNVDCNKELIFKAWQALIHQSDEFQRANYENKFESLFGNGHAAEKIKSTVDSLEFNSSKGKVFYDQPR